LIRIAGFDIDGTKKLAYALTKIKGVGVNLAHTLVKVAGLDPEIRAGLLSDDEIKRLEAIIKDPLAQSVKLKWQLNRQKHRATGEDRMLVGSDLLLQIKLDIERMQGVKSWKGLRHAWGLKVRGQRTRTTGRKGLAVGVRRKSVRE
jgi:small subunit ribosomal protein S13